MQSITKNNAAPQTSTSEEQAASKVQSENINFSQESKSFQHAKAGDQPCLSFLYAITDGKVLRTSHQGKEPKAASGIHKMSEEDRIFIQNGTRQARIIAKDFLQYLIRYDVGISPEEAQQLCVSANILDRVIS